MLDVDQISHLPALSKSALKPDGRVIFRLDGPEPCETQLYDVWSALRAVRPTSARAMIASLDRQGNCFVAGSAPSAQSAAKKMEHSCVLLLLPDKISAALRGLADNIYKGINALGITVEAVRLATIGCRTEPCISLLEAESPLLFSMGKAQFDKIHGLLLSKRPLLWLTRGAQMHVSKPKGAPFVGLARTLRSETATRKVVSLDVDADECLWSDAVSRAVVTVAGAAFAPSPRGSPATGEAEFVFRNGGPLHPQTRAAPGSKQDHRGRQREDGADARDAPCPDRRITHQARSRFARPS